MIAHLKHTLRILKFYTNNDFAFKDVHNEQLFLQNGKILVEVVQLFEKFRIIGSENLQMLGDLFEQLLSKGFKQNEGQFFTPVPITRFIWNSLPVEKILKTEEGAGLPKIIDKTTPRLIQFHTLKNAVNPPFLGGFSIFSTVVA